MKEQHLKHIDAIMITIIIVKDNHIFLLSIALFTTAINPVLSCASTMAEILMAKSPFLENDPSA